MTLRVYKVTLGAADGRTRIVHVPSPTDVQAGDAAAPLMQGDEAILSIERVRSDDPAPIDADPPRSQAAELAPVTPGMAAAPEPGRGAGDKTQGEPPKASPTSAPDAGFAPREGQTARAETPASTPQLAQDRPADIDGDPGELNRGLGQERVGEAGPGPQQRPLAPAAGGPGTGAGSSATPPAEDQGARTPPGALP